MLLISKLSVIDALQLINQQIQNENFKEIIKKIIHDVKTGNSLSKSFSKYPEIFSDIYIANLKVAEETGYMAEVISDFTVYQEKFVNLKKKIVQAVRYPIFVIVISIGVIFFMLFFLIPTFESLFVSVKAKIPALTKFLLDISKFMIDNYFILIVTLILSAFGIRSLLKSYAFRRNYIDILILKIPLVSSLYKMNLLARFSLSMSILLKSKVTLVDSLKISKNVTSNSQFQLEISKLLKKLIKGESFTDNIKNSKFFDFTFTKLLAAGEASAELTNVFQLISEYYSEEFDHKLDNLTSFIEPVLILFVGGIIAVVLVAMYLPMFEIINYLGV
ncbi:MAG: type II secretion system F family protein [Ignavibacteriae bacterium]|nr:type II secretion system F family protein [Ignavibacteriota bacterium]